MSVAAIIPKATYENHRCGCDGMPPERLEVLARAKWRLGERALYELLAELLAEPRCDVATRINAYAQLTPAQLYIVRADRMPPRIFAVGGGR